MDTNNISDHFISYSCPFVDKHTVSFGLFVASLATMRYAEFRDGIERYLS
jgi:hypothetical protein